MKKVYLLALLAALLAGALTFLLFSQMGKGESASVPMKDVVVAAEDVPAYTTITKSMVKVVQMPASAVHPQAAKSADQVVGMQSSSQFVEKEQVLTCKLAEPEEVGSALSYQLDDGRYAYTISVLVAPGVGGYLTKGDQVNLIGAVTDAKGNARRSRTIVERAEVLRVGDNSLGEDEKEYTSITLSLTRRQCYDVYLYQAKGAPEIWAALCKRRAPKVQ